jgi:eukaryotic-like serine/threonine-protein kinase
MESDRFQRVMQAFEQASILPRAAWHDFAHREFADDPEALAELLDLLRRHDSDSDLVGTGVGLEAAGGAMTSHFTPATDQEGKSAAMPRLRGDYRILRTIGEGGMGVVFEAEQDFPRRRVALKALRPGMASQRMLRRFKNEADFLARLQHPHIAQIYDAGIADEGTPDQAFFAMELVDGQSLTAFATTRRLSHEQRWRLLLKVCDAIQHAHQRGVIHRDLKPANILVNGQGEPKVVDFGVARAAQKDAAASMATRDGQLIGTPAYMSPEQLRLGDVDTRSDIYALGVVAYELLTGHLPFNIEGLAIVRASELICNTDPIPMSRFDRGLRGDPEVIVAKAMAKEPARRYSSAGELGEDIRRMLEGEAILARRESAMYVLSKQVQRHRAASGVAGVALLSLVGFAIYASMNARTQAKLARDESVARAQAQAALQAAERASQEASKARDAAQEATNRALAELTQATIERGRLAAASGNLPLAEDILWPAFFKNPESKAPFWGLWDTFEQSGTEWLVRATGWVGRAATAASARTIALASGDAVSLFDAMTGERLRTSPRLGAMTFLTIAPDASRIYFSPNAGGVRCVDMRAQTPVDPPAPDAPPAVVTFAGLGEKPPVLRTLSLSTDGSRLAGATNDHTLYVWNTADGSLVRSWKAAGQCAAITLNAEGTILAVANEGAGDIMGVRVYDAASGGLTQSFNPFSIQSAGMMLFSKDSKLLYFEDNKRGLIAWNLASNATQFVASTRLYRVIAMALSPDGTRLLAADTDWCRILDAQTGQVIKQMPSERFQLASTCWLSDDEVTVASTEGLIRRLDLRPDRAVRRIPYDGWCFETTSSRNGHLLVISGGMGASIDTYDAATLEKIASYTLPLRGTRVRAIEVLKDDRTLVAGCADGFIRIIDGFTGQVLRQIFVRNSEIYALAINAAEDRVVVGHWDRTTNIFNLQTGEHICSLPVLTKRVEGLAFSPDESILVISGHTKALALWDLAKRELLPPIETSTMPWNIAFSPDGQSIYATTQNGTLDVIDWPSRTLKATVQGHQRLAPGLAVSPDGQYIATAGEEGLINLWDARTLRTLITFKPQSSIIVSLAFSPDSGSLAASSAAREVVVYDLHAHDERVLRHVPMFKQRYAP